MSRSGRSFRLHRREFSLWTQAVRASARARNPNRSERERSDRSRAAPPASSRSRWDSPSPWIREGERGSGCPPPAAYRFRRKPARSLPAPNVHERRREPEVVRPGDALEGSLTGRRVLRVAFSVGKVVGGALQGNLESYLSLDPQAYGAGFLPLEDALAERSRRLSIGVRAVLRPGERLGKDREEHRPRLSLEIVPPQAEPRCASALRMRQQRQRVEDLRRARKSAVRVLGLVRAVVERDLCRRYDRPQGSKRNRLAVERGQLLAALPLNDRLWGDRDRSFDVRRPKVVGKGGARPISSLGRKATPGGPRRSPAHYRTPFFFWKAISLSSPFKA